MGKKHPATLPNGKEPDVSKIYANSSIHNQDLAELDTAKKDQLPERTVKPRRVPVSNAAPEEKKVTIRISTPSLRKFPVWVLLIAVIVGGSMSVGIPTLASLDLASITSNTNPVNVDSKTFVVSRVRFDPTSTITIDGATAAGATAVFTQVVKANFLSEMGDIITIKGIKVQNLGTTSSIAAVEVIAPQGISVDVRSPPGAGNELRLLGTNTFALPIDGGSSTTPGSAEIEIRLIILTGPLDPTTSQQFSIEVGISALD